VVGKALYERRITTDQLSHFARTQRLHVD
jgi:hypothetical protein